MSIKSNRLRSIRSFQILIVLILICSVSAPAADTAITNQIGQGVLYRRYHFDNLYNSSQNIFIIDINLNDPSIHLAFPYGTNGTRRTVSNHAATVPGAVGCVNAQFFSASGPVQFFKVNGATITLTGANVHDPQAVTDTGTGLTNSIGITLRPGAGWSSLSTANIIASGPDLIRNGVKFTSYDLADGLVVNRHPRTCAAWTYDNHLLLVVVDGRSSISAGMTLPELRDYLFSIAPVRHAFNLDGGGSSTLWTVGGVKNVPSDGSQRAVANAIAVVAPPPAIPSAPTILTSTFASDRANLSWPSSAGTVHYNIKRSAINGGPYNLIATTNGTSFVDTNFSAGVRYYYVVSAVNFMGESSTSPQTSILTPPGLPMGFTASPGNARAILNWNATPGADSYNLRRATSPAGPYFLVASPTTLSYTNTGLVNGQPYYYNVNAVNATGSGPTSPYVSVIPQCPTPSIPINLRASKTNEHIAISWTVSSNAASYQLFRATSPSGPYTNLINLTATHFLDTLNVPGQVYLYKVGAVSPCDASALSPAVSAPFLLNIPTVTSNNITLSGWGGLPNQPYEVLQSTNQLPATIWTVIGTNTFEPDGRFRSTNSIDPSADQHYFKLQALP